MKKIITIAIIATGLLACNSSDKKNTENTSASTGSSPSSTTAGKQTVSAKIDGIDWLSDGDNVLAKYSEIDDRFMILTTDNAGKQDILLTMCPFSKIQAGSYSSNEVQKYGISILDTDKDPATELDFDNFTQGNTPDCIEISSIKDIGDGQQLVEGTFASDINASFNAEGKKIKKITDGRFSVVMKKP